MVGPEIGRGRFAFWFLVLTLVWAGPVLSQDQEPIRIEYEQKTIDPESKTIYLREAKFHRADFELRADRVLVWAGDANLENPGEIYAEGNVRYRRGKETLRADNLYYNFATGKAYVSNVRVRVRHERLKQDLTIRADRLKGIAEGHFRAKGITLSTCTFGTPHYDVYISEADVRGRGKRDPTNAYDMFPFAEWSLSADSLVPHFEGVPFFYLPAPTLHYPELLDLPIRSFRGGRSSRFGTYIYVDWGVKLTKGFIDSISPFDGSDETDDDRRWGDIELETDWRQERGGALGLDFEWEWDGYKGYIDTYFMHDLGRNDDSDFDAKFGPLLNDDRGRARLFHRHDLSDHWRYEVEVSYLSDRALLEEFFEQEFKEGKEQESLAYLRYREEGWGAYLMERHRLNDFQTQIEYLPRVGGYVAADPLPGFLSDILFLTSHLDVSNMRLRYDEKNNLGTQEVLRTDFLNEIRAPIDASIAMLTPFAALRTTFWDDDLMGHSQLRNIWSLGGRLSLVANGVHDVDWDLVGLHGLRHIIQLDGRYAANVRVNGGRENLFVFDEVDTLDEFEEVSIVFRNRFQTKTEDGETHEFLSIGLAIEYYPHLSRDTVTPVSDNSLPPFHWITLAPGETGGFTERHWSNLHWEVNFDPGKRIYARGRGEYNPEDSREEVRDLRVGMDIPPWFNVTFGQTLVRDVSNAVSGSLIWRPGEKWSLIGSVSYDFEREDYLSRRFAVGRDLHDLILEVSFERDETRDDTRFLVSLIPKFLGSKAISSGHLRDTRE